tara:strand:- start:3 stop:281 length:279 start_codon:yes stop_codon:yes gene_type:complete
MFGRTYAQANLMVSAGLKERCLEKMKQVKFIDDFKTLKVLMCEKHFAHYRPHMDDAMKGGTTYVFESTNKRGCELCKQKKTDGINEGKKEGS